MVGRLQPAIGAGRKQRRTDLHRQAILLSESKLLEQLIILLLRHRSGMSRRARRDPFAELNNLPPEQHDLSDGVASVHTPPFLQELLLARSRKGYDFSHCHLQCYVRGRMYSEALLLNRKFLTGSRKAALIQIKKKAPI